MKLIALAALLALQDPSSAQSPDAAAREMPTEPRDAETLIDRMETRWTDWNGLVGEVAARTAREAFAADLVYPEIARTDLEDGARGPIMQAGQTRLAEVTAGNTTWAAAQLDPETFAEFHDVQPRAARDLLRMANRDAANLAVVVAALEPLALAGRYDGAVYAEMADRLAVQEGRPQPYATQMHCVDGVLVPYEVVEPDTLDNRRAAIGLDPVDPEQLGGLPCPADRPGG